MAFLVTIVCLFLLPSNVVSLHIKLFNRLSLPFWPSEPLFSSSNEGSECTPPLLNVLLVNHGYPPTFNGGSEIYTQNLAIGLLQNECKVSVFAREQDPFKSDFNVRCTNDSLDSSLPVYLVNMAREAPYHRFVYNEMDREFEKLLLQLKPDIVHFGHLNHLSVNLCQIAKRLGAKVVYTLHDYWLMCPRGQFLVSGVSSNEPLRQCSSQNDRKCAMQCYSSRFGTGLEGDDDVLYAENWVKGRMAAVQEAMLSIDAFIAPSLYLHQRFAKKFLKVEKIVLLPYGFDNKRLYPRKRNKMVGSEGKKFVFAYIGRHEASKGIHLLIEAINKLVQRGVSEFKVIIFGRSNAIVTPPLQRMIKDFSLENFIEWREEYDNNDIVSKVFDHVDAIVVPSIWEENSPLVIQEAQQCRVLVITSNFGGMAELVQNNVNGLTFDHRDSSSLMDCMLLALQQPHKMQDLGGKGYLHSDDGNIPSLESHVQEILGLYTRILSNQQVQPSNSKDIGSEYPGLLNLLEQRTGDVEL